MEIFRKVDQQRQWSRQARARSQRIAFVPTMGALHEGHLSLIRRAAERADLVVVSLFVNPTQFNDRGDFAHYPRDEERDLDLCRDEGVDAVFLPDHEDIYPQGASTWVEEDELSGELEGALRPGHFRGVTTVVSKLLHVVEPQLAIFGRKDAQQARVIERMVRDLLLDVQIDLAPIVREADGLAMSSRNVRLTLEHRRQATALSTALGEARKAARTAERDPRQLERIARDLIANEAPDGEIDYVRVCDWRNLRQVEGEVGEHALMLLAVAFGPVRLLDNEWMLR